MLSQCLKPIHLKKVRGLLSKGLVDYLVCQGQERTQEGVTEQLFPDNLRRQLESACKRALGNDITLKPVGSLAQGTASDQDSDVDVEIRYTGDRLKESFTEEDKQKVRSKLKALPFVSDLQVGNAAFKFEMQRPGQNEVPIHVDLVLFRKRPEEFQFLRGGTDFVKNSARINRFFSEFPAARAAVIAVKTLFKREAQRG